MTSKTETPDIGEVENLRILLEGAVVQLDLAERRARKAEAELAKHQWRTMESAPKDGTPLLIAGRGWVAEGYYESDGDRGWYSANTDWTDAYDGSLYPTHWQPLPSPPGENDG